jgi:nickel/cobalt exporter
VIAAALIASGTRERSRRARLREAAAVGAAVTLAHTASVLAVAAVLTAFATTLSGRLLGWFQVASGLLVVLVGTALLRAALRRRRGPAAGPGHDPAHGHGHGHTHGHGHAHGHGQVRGHGRGRLAGFAGVGLAGGLTPSPAALLLLLGANAAGRAWVGVAAVVAFGAGMALTLTLVGTLVARTGDRLLHRPARHAAVRRLSALAPQLASAAVMTAGSVLLLRGLGQAIG